MATKEEVMHVLDKIDDPELRKPLTDLGMVKSVDIKGDQVAVGITLTIPGCPLKQRIRDDIINGIKQLDGVESVTVEFDIMTDEQRAKLREKLGMASPAAGEQTRKLDYAKRFIAVSSGKGGVGKSTVTTNIASALARMGRKVGLLDADVYGFSIPRMLGISGQPTIIDDKIVPLRKGDNMQIVSIGFFIDEDEAVVWRGPLLHKAINQFLSDAIWDDLDYLLLDLPPGTGDVTLTIAQALPNAEILIVTTPQATATHVAGRVAKLAEKTELKLMGVVENMSYYERDDQRDYIFGKGGGKQLAEQLGVHFFGEIPLTSSIRQSSDEGKPIALVDGAPEAAVFEKIARAIDKTK